MVPESIRWLITHRRADKAKLIILKAANMNKIKLSEDVIESLQNTSCEEFDSSVISLNLKDEHHETFSDVLRSKILVIRLVLIIFILFIIKLVNYGMTIHSVTLAGNKHVNYIFVSGVELPSNLLSFILMNWIGRKQSLFMTLTGIACVKADLIPNSALLASILVYIFGKCCITTAFSIRNCFRPHCGIAR